MSPLNIARAGEISLPSTAALVVVRWSPALLDQLHRAGVEDLGQSVFRSGEVLQLRLGVAEPDCAVLSVNMIIQADQPG